MGVITISRGSYSKGKEIAEKLAQKLGYDCISREILLQASEQFNVKEAKLIRALHDAPSFFDRFKHGKEKFSAFIHEVFLGHIQKDNVIYHGLAGHYFARGIPNILKVRINASIEDRVKEEMKRENIPEQEARHLLIKDDEERRKWGISLYGIDTRDFDLYDVVLQIDSLKVDDAVDILCDIAKRPSFQTTSESRMIIKDKFLAAKAYSAIVHKFPQANVTCKDAVVFVSVESSLSLETEIADQIKDLLKDNGEIKEIRAGVMPLGTD
ncbi:MAG: cytidylate kinase-like family protein [Desulfobacterales bacterium]|nr:MAG: cytidylate kinase-like family protein [Desulfobacterales bacterium]